MRPELGSTRRQPVPQSQLGLLGGQNEHSRHAGQAQSSPSPSHVALLPLLHLCSQPMEAPKSRGSSESLAPRKGQALASGLRGLRIPVGLMQLP